MDTTQISRFLFDFGRLSAQAGVLVLLVLVAQWIFRKQLAPRWRSALWFLVALRLVMPFSLSSATSVFNLLPDWPPRAGMRAQMAPSVFVSNVPEMPTAPRIDSSPSVLARGPETVQSPAPVPRWPVWVLAAWLIGVGLLAGRVAISSVRFWRRCQRLQPLLEPAAVEVLEKCCERLGVWSRPVLVESVEVKSPGLYGLWRPRLLFPKGFTAQFSSADLQFVFLHELAHLKRRDLWLNWVMAVLQVIHWFNPLVWMGFSRWRADREMACDAMALEAAGQERNLEYGRTILRLLENFAHPSSTPNLVGILEDKCQLQRRMTMIAGYMPAKGWPVLAAVLTAGLAVVGLTDARSQAASDELLPVTNSQQPSGYDIHLNNHNLITQGPGGSLVAIPPMSNSIPWRLEGQLGFAARSNWTSATSNFDFWMAAQSVNDLIGAWVLVGTPDKVEKAPAAGGRLKFFTGKSFCITQADPKTGVVIYHHGGAYALDGNDYVEMVDYANPTTMNFIGGTNGHYKLKLEGETLTLIGVNNSRKEVWKRADKPAAAASQAARDMMGTWVFVGKPGEAGEIPTTGGRFKFITSADWCDTYADSKTGVVIVHHGGTCTFKGNQYVQTVKYANPGSMDLIGHSFKFTTKVEGDTLTLTGIGNPWNEVWKRVK